MSLTSDIAALVARYEALAGVFDTKKLGIDTALAAAISALPNLTRIVYVDQLNGSDVNDGLATDRPIQTLTRALNLGGPGRSIDIRLLRDYSLTQARVSLPVSCSVRIRSHNSVQGSIKYKLFLGVHAVAYNDQSGAWEVGGFYCQLWGSVTLNVSDVEIVFPQAPVGGPLVADRYNAFLASHQTDGPALVGLEINWCTITRPSGSVGKFIGTNSRGSALSVKSSTYVTAEMAGNWASNVASGTTPQSLGWLLSNLVTL